MEMEMMIIIQGLTYCHVKEPYHQFKRVETVSDRIAIVEDYCDTVVSVNAQVEDNVTIKEQIL
jgi:hypothetical protein